MQVVDPAAGDIGGSDGANLQRNKRSIALDLKSPEGLDAFLALIDRADVFVENLRPSVKVRLGIGPAVLLARNPRLVYASLSGFGQDGPYAERGGLDQIAQGMGGVMSVTGPPGTGPWRVGIAISDTASGTFLTQGVLAALFARERTGRGQWVYTSLLEAMVNLMDFQACRWLTDGDVPPQQGNDHPTFFPMGTYRCADGYVNIAGLKHLQEFLDAIGAGEATRRRALRDRRARKANRNEFNAACEARLAALTMTEVVERLERAQTSPRAGISLDQVFADPQVQHLGLYQTRRDRRRTGCTAAPPGDAHRHPGGGRLRSTTQRRRTRSVLQEVGYSDEEIDALLASGAAVRPRRHPAGSPELEAQVMRSRTQSMLPRSGMASSQPATRVDVVACRDVPEDLDGHGRRRHVLHEHVADGVGDHQLHRLVHRVDLAGVGHPHDLVAAAVGVGPLVAEPDFLGRTPPRVGVVELLDVHMTQETTRCRSAGRLPRCGFRRHRAGTSRSLRRRPGSSVR